MVQTRKQWAADISESTTKFADTDNKIVQNSRNTPKNARPAAKKRTPTKSENAEMTKRRAKVVHPEKTTVLLDSDKTVLSLPHTEYSKKTESVSDATTPSKDKNVLQDSCPKKSDLPEQDVITISDSEEEDEWDRQQKLDLFAKIFIKGFEDMQKAEMSNRIRSQSSFKRIH